MFGQLTTRWIVLLLLSLNPCPWLAPASPSSARTSMGSDPSPPLSPLRNSALQLDCLGSQPRSGTDSCVAFPKLLLSGSSHVSGGTSILLTSGLP